MSFNSDIREEMNEMKKSINKIQSESIALEILQDQRKQNKRMFVVWLITFIAFVGLLSYTIWLLNDIGYEEVVEETTTTEYNQDISNSGDINDSNIVNGGDING